MSIDLVILTLLLIVILYITIIEIFTIIFMLTGMSNTRARFQVISLLTGCGFTTTESEVVVSSRKRRKIAITIMIFGNIFNVVVVSILVNALMAFSKNKSFNAFHTIIYLLVFLTLIMVIRKVPFVKVIFDSVVKHLAAKIIFSKKSNPLLVLDNFHGYVIAEIKIVEIPEKLRDISLLESRISKDYDIRILNIKRDDLYIGHVSKDEIIRFNDRVMAYGPIANIVEVFGQKPSHYVKTS